MPSNEISERQLDAATKKLAPAMGKTKDAFTQLTEDDATQSIDAILRQRLDAIGVSIDVESIPDASYLIGFVVGRLQAASASIEQVHTFVDELHNFRPHDDYEIMMFGSGACGIVEGMHADKLWRTARILRAAVQEIYISLRNLDATVNPGSVASEEEDPLWAKAIAVADLFVDILYPMIKNV